jgi:hypothetical protein
VDPQPPWRPYAAVQLAAIAGRLFAPAEPAAVTQLPPLSARQLQLVNDIVRYVREQKLPVMVASIPARESLLNAVATPDDVRQFADMLDARFVDGNQIFAGLSEKQIRAHWLPYDGHWEQSGSDRFADAIWQAMQNWP